MIGGGETAPEVVSILVVDDHPVVLAGLRALLDALPDLAVVATAGSVEQALGLPAEPAPDVCVVDLRLPDGDGIALAAELKQRWPGTRALILTLTADAAEVVRSLGSGLDGYVLKDSAPAELVAAVRSVAHGSTVLGRGTSTAVGHPVRQSHQSPLQSLDARDREILDLLADGLGVASISGRLYLAPKTIRNRLTELVRTLGVANRDEAVALVRAEREAAPARRASVAPVGAGGGPRLPEDS